MILSAGMQDIFAGTYKATFEVMIGTAERYDVPGNFVKKVKGILLLKPQTEFSKD